MSEMYLYHFTVAYVTLLLLWQCFSEKQIETGPRNKIFVIAKLTNCIIQKSLVFMPLTEFKNINKYINKRLHYTDRYTITKILNCPMSIIL